MTPAAAGAPALRLERGTCVMCGTADGRAIASGRDWEYGTSDLEFTFVACRGCGHVYLDPRPTIDSAPAIYPPTYYAVSGAHRSGALTLLGRIKDVVVSHRVRASVSALPRGARVLEAGCGDGSLLLVLRRVRPDLRLVGLDLQMSASTRHTLEAAGVETMETTLEQARFTEPLDMVVMNQLIEHVWDPRGVLASLHAGLRPGGLLSISTPNLDGYDRPLFTAHAWGGYHFPRHLNLFTRESLGRFVAACGFEPVSTADLAAPLVWVTSLHNVLASRRRAAARWFTDSNLAVLALATVVDLAMAGCRVATSNQQLIARRPAG